MRNNKKFICFLKIFILLLLKLLVVIMLPVTWIQYMLSLADMPMSFYELDNQELILIIIMFIIELLSLVLIFLLSWKKSRGSYSLLVLGIFSAIIWIKTYKESFGHEDPLLHAYVKYLGLLGIIASCCVMITQLVLFILYYKNSKMENIGDDSAC